MKPETVFPMNQTYFAPAVLFVAAVITLGTAAATNRGDMTSAVLVLAGFMLLITGVFLLTLIQKEPLPRELSAMLPVSGTINTATMLAELGVTANTLHRYLPERSAAIQINPVTGGIIPDMPEDMVFISGGEWSGVSYPAVAGPLLHRLKTKDHLQIPEKDENMLAACLREVFCDTLCLAEKLSVTRSDRSVTIRYDNFAMPETCIYIHAVSVKCCTMVGCPVCSLAGCIIAESEKSDVMTDSVRLSGRELTAVYSLYPRG
jgi:hypothetical protein